MMQTSIDRSFCAKRYEPCFWDVRAAVTDKATDRTCLIVDRLPWKRAFNDMIYEVKCDDLTIKAHGWPDLLAGDIVTIRRSSEVPEEYHTLQCKLKNLTKAQVLKTLVGALGHEFGRPVAYLEFSTNQAGKIISKIGGCQAEAHARVITGPSFRSHSPSFQRALMGFEFF